MEDTLEMKFIVSDGETGYEEIKKESYRYAKDTVKKGDSIDFLSFFCGVFALICMLIVLYFGTVGGFTDTMIYLMVLYVFIAIFSLCTPLQILISGILWNAGFKKRLAVNCGYEKELYLSEEEVKVCGKNGEELYANYSECFFFETPSFIILNVTDRKLFPVAKEELDKEELEELRRFCINDYEEAEETSMDAEAAVSEPISDVTKAECEKNQNEEGCVEKNEGDSDDSEEYVGEAEENSDDSEGCVGKVKGNSAAPEGCVGKVEENSDDSEEHVGEAEENSAAPEECAGKTKEKNENDVEIEDINETVESEKITEE